MPRIAGGDRTSFDNRIQTGKPFESSLRSIAFVLRQGRIAITDFTAFPVLDGASCRQRNDFIVEGARLLACCSTLLRLQRILILGFAVPPAVMSGRSEISELMSAIEMIKERDLNEGPTHGT